jgi:hypothetical protein
MQAGLLLLGPEQYTAEGQVTLFYCRLIERVYSKVRNSAGNPQALTTCLRQTTEFSVGTVILVIFRLTLDD